jgi:hypothetical protein
LRGFSLLISYLKICGCFRQQTDQPLQAYLQ